MRWLLRAISAACFCVVGLALLRCSSTDFGIEIARRRMLAMSPSEAAAIVSFCRSWHGDGALLVSQFPTVLPAGPTSIESRSGTMQFQYWNHSHVGEDRPHPAFEIICAETAPRDTISLAPGLWYRDTPMSGE